MGQHERESLMVEQELVAVRDKLRRAKVAKKILVPICAVVLLLLAVSVGVLANLLLTHGRSFSMPTFDQIVEVPEDAPLNEGVSPSDEQFRAARVDAWTFLNGDFAEFSKREIGMLDLAEKMLERRREETL